jgi:hypothetical protein
MGGFINSQADNEICEVLNKRFSDEVKAHGRTYISLLRDHFQQKENLFDANHHLHRVFHRLAFNLTGHRVPRNNQSRYRWLFLLGTNLPAAVTDAIKGQLTAILSPVSAANPAGAVDYVTFSTQHVTTSTGTFELWPQNSSTATIHTDANGKRYCTIILQCHTDVALPNSPNETDPPNSDSGEKTFAVPAKSSATKKSSRKKTTTQKRKAKK